MAKTYKYKEADKYVTFNDNDKDLVPITIPLPEPPPYEEIDGYGLAPEDQYFRRQDYPSKLIKLEKDSSTLDEIWSKMDKNKRFFWKEIQWIREQWRRRLNGYWFFNNGKPTYIDGWMYFYCNFWNLDIGLPKYRDRDRRFFLFARFCYTTSIDDKGIDRGYRTCLGFNYPKHRREGASYKAECINYEIVSRQESVIGGIQAMDESTAKMVFRDKLVKPWKKMPFFFKPLYEGSTDPKEVLSFNPPAVRIASKGSLIRGNDGLDSSITYAASADRGAYDGWKLYFLHNDELGKTVLENVYERWLVQRKCLAQNTDFHGLAVNTSTVGDMTRGGGENFYKLCMASDFSTRTELGFTNSYLYNLFIPAYDGLDGFIDRYGMSIIDTPTPEQAEYIKKNIGAKQYLVDERRSYLNANDIVGHSEEVRLRPMTFRECFRTSAKDTGFDINIIDKRMDELRFPNLRTGAMWTTRGDLMWRNNVRDSEVIWTENATSGKFRISKTLDYHLTNRRYSDNGIWFPETPIKYVASGDPFKFETTEGHRKSNGAGAVFWLRDYNVDPDVVDGDPHDIRQWESNRFVCTYNMRVENKEEYLEDMLMMCVYWGAMMYPEINLAYIMDHFNNRKYGGYLYYDVDERTGKRKTNPGFNSLTATKNDIFSSSMQYIKLHGHREHHIELLDEYLNIPGIEKMKDYDLFTAAGGCLLAAQKPIYRAYVDGKENETGLDDFFRTYSY